MHNRGFTLLETLLYSVLSATVLGAVFVFISISFEGSTKQRVIVDVESEGAAALERVVQLVRGAESITTPVQGATSSTLELVARDAADDPIVIYASGGILYVEIGSSGARELTSTQTTVESFEVANYSRAGSPGSIQFTMTLASQNPSNTQPYEYRRTFNAAGTIRYE